MKRIRLLCIFLIIILIFASNISNVLATGSPLGVPVNSLGINLVNSDPIEKVIRDKYGLPVSKAMMTMSLQSVTAGKTISGNISLPQGMLAPEGGLNLWVEAYDSGNEIISGIFTGIPQGINTIPYQFTVPNTTSTCKVQYWIYDVKGLSIVKRGFYSTSGSKAVFGEGSLLDVNGGNKDNINIGIMPGKIITGLISLPQGMKAPEGGLEIFVDAFDSNENLIPGSKINIAQGEASSNYQITVPLEASNQTYKVGYWLQNSKGLNLLTYGYYGNSASATTISQGSFVDVSLGNITTGIDIEIIECRIISGTLSLPQGMQAPVGGVEVLVVADVRVSQNLWSPIYAVSVMMPAGANSVGYVYKVPLRDVINGCKISYWLNDARSLSPMVAMRGYYSKNGTKASFGLGDLLDVSSGNIGNINLQAISGNTVGGTVALPQGMQEPTGGLPIWVEAVDENNFFLAYTYVVLQGNTAQPYSLVLPTEKVGQGYKLRYWIDDTKGLNIKSPGYYSTSGTKENFEQGSFVNVSSGAITGINIGILSTAISSGRTLSGTLSLPQDLVAPTGGMTVQLNTSNGYVTSRIIPAGRSKLDFTLQLPENIASAPFTLSYSVHQKYGYVSKGYFSKNGTKPYVEDASIIDLCQGNASGINLEILTGKKISGKLMLPNGYKLDSKLVVWVEAGYKDSLNLWISLASTSVIIQSNTSINEYSLTVPSNTAGTGYLVRYYTNTGFGIQAKGYYTNGRVDVSAADQGGIDIKLTKEVRTLTGDVNNDLKVDIDDLVSMALAYDSTSTNSKYELWADLNSDDAINMRDLASLASNYGNEVSAGGALREATFSDPITLMPFMATDNASYDVLSLVYMSLLTRDFNGNIIPDMAESYTVSADNEKVTFYLRHDVKWHDGMLLTAQDVKFSYDLIRDPAVRSPRLGMFSAIESINIIDDYIIEFNLNSIDAFFLSKMTNGYIIPHHIWKDADKTKLTELSWTVPVVGNGPFKLVEKNRGQSYVFEANTDFYQGKPRLDSYTYMVNPSQATAMNKIVSGQAEMAAVPAADINKMKQYENVNVSVYDTTGFECIVYNLERDLLKDKNVRQAISYAIDKQRIIDEFLDGYGTVADGSYSPHLWYYNANTKKYNFNIAEANRLLEEAGWVMGVDGIRQKSGQKLEFTIITNKGNVMREKVVAYIAQVLKEIGMDVSYECIDWTPFITNYVETGNFDAYVGGFSTSLDGDQSAFYSSDPALGYLNRANYSNARVDELLALGRSTLDLNLQKVYYDELQQIIAEEQPYTFLTYRKQAMATSQGVKNIKMLDLYGKWDILKWHIQP